MSETHQHHSEVVKRLRRASGHLDKVIAMIEAGEPCVEVAQQLQAVHSAVGNAKNLFVRDHIEHCMEPSALGDLKKAREVLEDLREISKYL